MLLDFIILSLIIGVRDQPNQLTSTVSSLWDYYSHQIVLSPKKEGVLFTLPLTYLVELERRYGLSCRLCTPETPTKSTPSRPPLCDQTWKELDISKFSTRKSKVVELNQCTRVGLTSLHLTI